MKTITMLALALSFNVASALAETPPAASPARPAKLRKAKRAPALETIRAACPSMWSVDKLSNRAAQSHGSPKRDIWFYNCEETGVTVTIPAEQVDARVTGSVKGNKDAGWYR